MKSFLAVPLAAMLIAGSSIVMVAQPAMAWTPAGCDESPLPPWATTPGGKDYCRGVNAGSPVTNNNNTNNNSQNQHQGQHQQQGQNQSQTASANNVNSVNNRLNQSLVNSPTSYTNVRETGQLPMVNAPDCGGVNAGVSADLQGSVALSAAVHFGRRPDSCVHHDDAPPTTNVHVDVAASQPVIQPAPTVVHEVRTVYVKESHRCANYPAGDLRALYLDLKAAKHTRNTFRINRDRTALEAACRGDLVDRAIDP